jgi:transcriptional regulator with XRE-family HTH domain
MGDNVPYFAARLKGLREKAGLGQSALARKVGLSRQAVSQLEKGDHAPCWLTVQRLALALGVDYAEFADPDVTLPPAPEKKKRGRSRKVSS